MILQSPPQGYCSKLLLNGCQVLLLLLFSSILVSSFFLLLIFSRRIIKTTKSSQEYPVFVGMQTNLRQDAQQTRERSHHQAVPRGYALCWFRCSSLHRSCCVCSYLYSSIIFAISLSSHSSHYLSVHSNIEGPCCTASASSSPPLSFPLTTLFRISLLYVSSPLFLSLTLSFSFGAIGYRREAGGVARIRLAASQCG